MAELRADHEDEKHDAGEPETQNRELIGARQTDRFREYARDVLNAHVRHCDRDREPSVEKIYEDAANRLVDRGHCADEHADAADAEHSVAEAPGCG